ncbi:hypothetical protein Zmor_018191 [Zophobas morio]|uniref:CRAL-TRIO domain-containing protein n=1 Tax=Zophobas morio TaxID=2755281 RepID=A0AA38MDL6_9CUCU|nr:hypothetical protein Zmor_018191 [Zophobas morio]
MTGNIDLMVVDDQIWQNAASLFNRSIKSFDEDVASLQEWLNAQPHLPKLLDSHCLRNFLVLNKCSVEVAKQKIENYYLIRSKMDDINQFNPKLPYKAKLNEISYVVMYPKLTKEMHRIFYIKVKNESLMSDYEPIDFLRKSFSIAEIRLREDVLVGDIFIADMKGFAITTIMKVTPTMFYKGALIYEKIFSMRVKGVYVINMPPVCEILLAMAKRILKPKVFERIHICPDMDSLKEIFPLDLLPEEFGGNGLSLDVLHEALEAKYNEYQHVFDSLDEVDVNENLIPKKNKADDILGVCGNFKKLEVD